MATATADKKGMKRICPSCSTRYYDLNKRPVICPNCKFEFTGEIKVKARRTRVVANDAVEDQVEDAPIADKDEEDVVIENEDVVSLEDVEEDEDVDEEEEIGDPDLELDEDEDEDDDDLDDEDEDDFEEEDAEDEDSAKAKKKPAKKR